MEEKIRNKIDNLFLELLEETRKDTKYKDEYVKSKCDRLYGYIRCASDMGFVSMGERFYLLDAMHTVCHFL